MLHRGALLRLQSLALRGRGALDVGGAEALLRLLGRGAQRLPGYLERKSKQEQRITNAQYS